MANFIVVKTTDLTDRVISTYIPSPAEVEYRLLNFSGVTTSHTIQDTEPEALVVTQVNKHEGERSVLERYRAYLMDEAHPFSIYCNENGITRTFSDIED